MFKFKVLSNFSLDFIYLKKIENVTIPATGYNPVYIFYILIHILIIDIIVLK